MENQIHRGRGAIINPRNKFKPGYTGNFHVEGIDDYEQSSPRTTFYKEYPKTIISKNTSPDVPFNISINPYQGCEHGCVYCYARETHQYWGYSAGLDFESKIIVKHNARELLERAFLNPKWQVEPVMLSGNTDCYQPAERKYKITRSLLAECLKFRNPVSLITKNSLILRDIDLLEQLASLGLVQVMISITTFNEELRRRLEPRTATSKKRLSIVEQLARKKIPVGVMIAPVIPGLNMSEIPEIIKQSAKAGAYDVSHTILRLNGKIEEIFKNWLLAVYPDKAQKILSQVQATHGGKVSDNRFMTRMLGEGHVAAMVAQMMAMGKQKYFKHRGFPDFTTTKFRRGGMYTIW
jgi:DNA repair photolyase